MSQVVTVRTEIRDRSALVNACARLNLEAPVEGTHQLYSGKAVGMGVKLPRWKYPVVANLKTGEVKFDNYEGHWGDESELDKLVQRYTVEAATAAASLQGYGVVEQLADNGEIKLEMTQY